MAVKQLIERHRALKFPSFPKNDDFADWVADLAEYDGHIIGLASSDYVTIEEFVDLKKFLRRLTLSKASSPEEELTLEEIKNYCSSLLNVARASLKQRVVHTERNENSPCEEK